MKTERQGLILHSKTPNMFKLVNMKVLLVIIQLVRWQHVYIILASPWCLLLSAFNSVITWDNSGPTVHIEMNFFLTGPGFKALQH